MTDAYGTPSFRRQRLGFRRFTQFRLRTLFVIVTGVCIVAMYLSACWREKDAVIATRAKFGDLSVRFDWQPECNDYLGDRVPMISDREAEESAHASGPAWLRTLLGDYPFQHVDRVTIAGREVDDASVHRLEAFKRLRVLRIPYAKLSDDAMRTIGGLRAILLLDLHMSTASTSGFDELASLDNLRILTLGQCRVTDADVKFLRRLKKLEALDLLASRITDNAIQSLVVCSNLESLCLDETLLTDKGVAQLSLLKKLRTLWLRHTHVSDDVVTTLAELPMLESVDIRNTHVTEAGVGRLRRVKPHLQITSDSESQ